MDKTEYRVMLDRITECVDEGDYVGALPIVENIDWRRVKSVRTLCMVSEIYEANEKMEDSLHVLKIAYKRAATSKTVLYRLSETCAKTGNYKEAVYYYKAFEKASPLDNSKYILKYEIYRAKGAPLKDQIAILEAYKEREYTEEWAYKLAELYHEAGDKDSCVEVCDDLILWFSEGPYVKKAMELKRNYVPLSVSQNKKYQEMCTAEAEAKVKRVNQREDFVVTSSAEETKSSTEIDLESIILANTESLLKDSGKDEHDLTVEEAIAANTVMASPSAIKEEPVVQIDPSRMQNQLADSIRAVFSGINKEPEDFVSEKEGNGGFDPVSMDMSGYEIKDLEPEATTAEVVRQTVEKAEEKPEEKPVQEERNSDLSEELLSKIDSKIDNAEVLLTEPEEITVKEVSEESDQITGQMSFTDLKQTEEFDLEALIAETTSALAQELSSGAFHMTADAAKETVTEEVAVEETAAEEAAIEENAIEENAIEENAIEENAIEEAAVEETVIEETIIEETAVEETIIEEAAAEEAVIEEAAVEENAVEENAIEDAAIENAVIEEIARETEKESRVHEKETDESLGLTREFNFHEELKKSESQNSVDTEDLEAAQAFAEAAATMREIEQNEDDLEIEIEFEEEKRFKYVPVEPRELTEKEKEIFSYFSKIPGMSQQITETISDVHNNAGDKTSRSGNFLIIGRQGSGKTKLYESMVLAICNDLDIKAAKMAKIIGRDLNKKDPVAIVSKLSGGFLVIEGAGELNDETVAKLSQAMEFRTDSLVVVLEDEKADLYAMLEKYPEFAEKFTSTIKIPVFTNDELVSFAKTYATESGYRMDEMGILALYTKIGDNQKNSEPVTVGKVKEIMDDAIEHANKGTRKLGRRFSKNTADEDDRILLLEKDFD